MGTSQMAEAADNAHVSSHYEQVGEEYESAFFYAEGPYNTWLAENVGKTMTLTNGLTLADVGGGTGHFTKMLVDAHSLGSCVVVDPSPAMLEKAQERDFATEL